MKAAEALRRRVEQALRGDPFLCQMLGASTVEGVLAVMGGAFTVVLADGTRVAVEEAAEGGWTAREVKRD